jgi:hypothetical protein
MIHGQNNRRGLVPRTLEGNREAAGGDETAVLSVGTPELIDSFGPSL